MCQGFFRRMLKEQLHKKFICTNGENCEIASVNRTNCKFCRFAKCLRVGMTLEGLYIQSTAAFDSWHDSEKFCMTSLEVLYLDTRMLKHEVHPYTQIKSKTFVTVQSAYWVTQEWSWAYRIVDSVNIYICGTNSPLVLIVVCMVVIAVAINL